MSCDDTGYSETLGPGWYLQLFQCCHSWADSAPAIISRPHICWTACNVIPDPILSWSPRPGVLAAPHVETMMFSAAISLIHRPDKKSVFKVHQHTIYVPEGLHNQNATHHKVGITANWKWFVWYKVMAFLHLNFSVCKRNLTMHLPVFRTSTFKSC